MRILVTYFVVLLCVGCGRQTDHYLNGIKYCVPEANLIPGVPYIDAISDELDSSVGVIALRFSVAKDLGLTASNEDEISAVLFSREVIGNEPALAAQYGRPAIDKFGSSLDVGVGLRLFEGAHSREWVLVPKTALEPTQGEQEDRPAWLAKCRPSGLSALESEASSVPGASTSCETVVFLEEHLLKLTATEQMLLHDYDAIVKGIETKVRSWRCQ